ncbi:MAG: protein translocase subunit SecD [Puniceicoccales bacterium]|nr:protein translocase subunit SecD [Puniceicoccales bacterium]
MEKMASFRRILISIAVVLIACYNLFPLRDRPFAKYVIGCVTNDRRSFMELVDRANELVASGKARGLFSAILTVADRENLDLSQFFRNKNVADIKNLHRKNSVLLESILADSKSRIKQGLDLKGGVSFVLGVSDTKFDSLSATEKSEQMNKAIDIIRQRIDGLGVAEPLVRIFGSNCIEIQLPGISTKDNPEIVDAIKKPAKLEFKLLHDTLVPKSKSERPPIGYEILEFENGVDDSNGGKPDLAFVKRIPEMTGSMVKHAGVTVGQYGEYGISLTMTDSGTKRFESVTSANINRRLGIVLDGRLYSAPVIRSAIESGHGSITGNFSQRDAFELANVLNNPLEMELKFIELNEIGPSLAEDARTSSLNASLIGAIVVVLFMVAYYHVAGLVSLIAVLANVVITLGIMATIGATLTLPGIAALVLTIGMAVDANILIFERMREEIIRGKSLAAALVAGHERALSSIVDANLTTLLTAIILVHFGTGPIRGFGVILSIGIFATIFCALVLSRGLLEILVGRGFVKTLVPNLRFRPFELDFLKYSKYVFIAYVVAVIACVAVVASRHTKIYGIDFTGGDEITIKFDKKIPMNEIDRVAAANGIGEVVSVYQKSASESEEILRIQSTLGSGEKLFESLRDKFGDYDLVLAKKTEIGASIGQGIKANAVTSVLLSMVGIMVYVAFRFEIGYGIGAVISTIMNTVLTGLIYLSLGHQISAPMVASILMVVGYSINDTIVVFDRIREELKGNGSETFRDMVNLSITRTLSRTVLTSVSTFFAALALYLFGSGVIVDFALVFMIGIAIGTFFSIFVASPIFYAWHWERGSHRVTGTRTAS